ncbi:hypothetical protein [uncultured Microbacterium sp.]|uniref:hypothetical protein n=1 Tax=uncultured Microbacterium sp. TaxID=191216 RepID=UPI0025DE87D9|nr:hypothetical protein [uncultured Microbacterium sp.]
MARWSAFELVLLNLADSEDYALLTAALYDYAGRLENEATDEDKRTAYSGPSVPSSDGPRLREAARRVRAMIDDIERQLDANIDARREAGHTS